jgi:hypothetical protein
VRRLVVFFVRTILPPLISKRKDEQVSSVGDLPCVYVTAARVVARNPRKVFASVRSTRNQLRLASSFPKEALPFDTSLQATYHSLGLAGKALLRCFTAVSLVVAFLEEEEVR